MFIKEVYVFGAGASYASASAPLGKDLVWHFSSDFENEFENAILYEKFLQAGIQYIPELEGELKKFRGRGEYLYNPPPFLKKEFYIDDLLSRTQKDGDEKTTEIIRQIIFEHIVQSHNGCNGSGKLYNLFIKDILKKKCPENTSIINFNFDYLLSDFSWAADSLDFDYILEFDFIKGYHNNKYQKEKKIKQIKLHGSLNWGICSQCRSLYNFFPHMQSGFYLNKKCEKCNSRVQPYIVMPFENERIEILWDEASGLISQADKITIIGYSFPEYDVDAIDLFKNAMREDILLEVVDIPREGESPCECKKRIMNQFRNMFSDPLLPNIESSRIISEYSNIEIKTSGFGGYLADKLGKP